MEGVVNSKRKIKIMKLGFVIVFVLSPMALIFKYLLWPTTPDISHFNWTQTAIQNDWSSTSPELLGFSPNILINLHSKIASNRSKNVHSLLLVRHGQLVFEQYYPVPAENDRTPLPNYYPPNADTYHQMRSITKTIISTLIGQMLYQNQLSNVDTPLYPFFEDIKFVVPEDKREITIRHALNFNSGINWNEWGAMPSDAMNMWLSSDPYRYVLSKGVAYPPGEKHVYQGAMSVLMGGVIEKVSGVNLREYADLNLFQPLGIKHFDWFVHEVTGEHLGSSGLYLRSRDLAKLGQLYLNKGVWDGQRLFAESWAEDSLKPSGQFWDNKAIQYGNNWWFPRITVNNKALIIAGMRGSGGQEMFILPEYDLVFVMTSGAYITQDEDYPFELLVNYILPSIGIKNAKYIARE
ncbi:MAG TPA: hypothetical protein DCS35_13880 [Vibrio sp.]|nr:hypothetical protein [Vibrio sp.]